MRTKIILTGNKEVVFEGIVLRNIAPEGITLLDINLAMDKAERDP